ncbi:16S rRNA (cytidine(1402)-2'-O)-methyltransferase [soil metagenome]
MDDWLGVGVERAYRNIAAALERQRFEAGALYVVATPIGNLADVTIRALATMVQADLIAAEDTRHTRGLLDRYGIGGELLACHEHNEREAAERVIEVLRGGGRVAYVSDAGTPGISDPGARLVDAVRTAGLPVVPVPGPSALAAAVSASGLEASAWHFAGFLPPRREARAHAIERLAALDAGLVIYEAPHRIVESGEALAAGLGATRRAVLMRELTKWHEQIERAALGELSAWLRADDDRTRGEFVICVEAPLGDRAAVAAFDAVLEPLLRELPLKQAVALTVEISGAPRNAVYARALLLKESGDA